MRARRPTPSQERLAELFSYDPDVGVLVAKLDRASRKHPYRAGDTVGYPSAFGYLILTVDGAPYPAHRIIWKLVAGTEPPANIDHKNRIKTDNRWANLRAATTAQNNANKGITRANSVGRKGVSFLPLVGKWRAGICVDGDVRHLGSFSSVQEAEVAYEDAARAHYGEFVPEDLTSARIVYETVLLTDVAFVEAVADARRAIIRLRNSATKAGQGKFAAALENIAFDIAGPLAKVDPAKYGSYAQRPSVFD